MIRVRLLRALRGTLGLTDTDIARVLSIPRASVRRIIGELRRQGAPIRTCTGDFYRLEE